MTTFKTPQDFMKMSTDFFAFMPKSQADATKAFEKIQTVFKTEYANSQDMWKTYQKATTGDATANEITSANKKAQELMKSTMFASVLTVPGAVFMLPAIIEKAKEYNIDLVPKSVSDQFDI